MCESKVHRPIQGRYPKGTRRNYDGIAHAQFAPEHITRILNIDNQESNNQISLNEFFLGVVNYAYFEQVFQITKVAVLPLNLSPPPLEFQLNKCRKHSQESELENGKLPFPTGTSGEKELKTQARLSSGGGGGRMEEWQIFF